MFGDNSDKSLQTTKDGAVDHDWSCRCLVRSLFIVIRVTILQIESVRELEVKLDSCTLERPLESIRDRNIDFGPVEGPIAGVEFPLPRGVFIKCTLQLLDVEVSEPSREDDV